MDRSDKAKKRGRSRAAWEGLLADTAGTGGVITLGGSRGGGGSGQRQGEDDLEAAIAASLGGSNGATAAQPHSVRMLPSVPRIMQPHLHHVLPAPDCDSARCSAKALRCGGPGTQLRAG